MLRRVRVALAGICASIFGISSLSAGYAIALHGGAGSIPKDLATDIREEYEQSLSAALTVGETILRDGGTALDAVEAVVRVLEDDPKFNAGRGSVLNSSGEVEMDASIMDGKTLTCGSVIGATKPKNPVTAARRIMEQSECVALHTSGADRFAAEHGCELRGSDYFVIPKRVEQYRNCKALGVIDLDHQDPEDRKYGTVGCVALDKQGNLAAATSTGGLVNKREGRVGDSPIIGAGTYANNASCAVSCTGQGEQFIRHTVAQSVAAAVQHGKKSLREASEDMVYRTLPEKSGGLIAVSKTGEIAMLCNTPGMYRAAVREGEQRELRIW